MFDLNPEQIALVTSHLVGEDPERIRGALGRIEADQRTWRYRLFAGRYRKQADRMLIERLKAKLED